MGGHHSCFKKFRIYSASLKIAPLLRHCLWSRPKISSPPRSTTAWKG